MGAPSSGDEAIERARSVAVDVAREEVKAGDEECAWPEGTMRALLDEGLGGLVVPERLGGPGFGTNTLVKVCEELGRENPSAGLCFGMHAVGVAVLAAKATDVQRETYLEPILAGDHITTLALSEPGTGVHFYFPRTRLEPTADGFVLNGSKSFVTNGSHADSYVTSTVTEDPHAPLGHFSCLVIDEGLDGMEWQEEWAGLGMRGNSARTVKLTDVRVPRHALLGEKGDEIWYVFHVVAPWFLAAMSGTYMGIASRALDEAIGHATSRDYDHSGRTLSDAPVLQHRIGELWAEVNRMRAFLDWGTREYDRGGPEALPAIMSTKANVAEVAVDVVNEALTVCGGRAYRVGGVLERCLRDARAGHVMAPTTDLLRIWTGRALMDVPILAED